MFVSKHPSGRVMHEKTPPVDISSTTLPHEDSPGSMQGPKI